MNNIQWISFIHIYQPPWQSKPVLDRIADESYRFLIETLSTHPNAHMTFNVAGTLLEQLAASGHSALIEQLRSLVKRGQVELTGSSYSHAFLPQLPPAEIDRQIALQEQSLKKYFGDYRPRGFFLPEMAYSEEVGASIKKAGYAWIILDPMSARDTVEPGIKYLDHRTGLAVVFRNRTFSRAYPPEELLKLANRQHNESTTIVTATDGELYGHFHKDWQQHLPQLLATSHIIVKTVSEYMQGLKESKPIHLRQASWETRSQQVRTNNPFTIWYNRSNPIHRQLWKLAHMAIDALTTNTSDQNFIWARSHLDRGLSSCSWWWASEVKTSPFAPIAWNPDEIEKGALELIKSIRSLQTLEASTKLHAEKIYSELMLMVWAKHWKSYGTRR